MDTVPIKAWTSATGHTIHNGNLVYFCPRTGFGEEQASNFPQLGVKGRKQVIFQASAPYSEAFSDNVAISSIHGKSKTIYL